MTTIELGAPQSVEETGGPARENYRLNLANFLDVVRPIELERDSLI